MADDERFPWEGPYRIEAIGFVPTKGGIDRWRINGVSQRDGRMYTLHTFDPDVAATLAAVPATEEVWLIGYSKRSPYRARWWWNTVIGVDRRPSDTMDAADWAAIDTMLDEEAAR